MHGPEHHWGGPIMWWRAGLVQGYAKSPHSLRVRWVVEGIKCWTAKWPARYYPTRGQAHKVINVSGQPKYVGVDRHPYVPSWDIVTVHGQISQTSRWPVTGEPINKSIHAENRYASLGEHIQKKTNWYCIYIWFSDLRLTLPSEGNQSPTPGTRSFSPYFPCAGLFYHSEGRASQPIQKKSFS